MSLLRREVLTETAMELASCTDMAEEEILDILESNIGSYMDRLIQYEEDIYEFSY